MVDLHLHTTASDGVFAPTQVLKIAAEAGLDTVAITDHNTVDAYDEILKNRATFPGRVLHGVELSTSFDGEGIELLGYGIDVAVMKREIKNNMLTYRQKQLAESKLLLPAFLKKGVKLSEEFAATMAQNPEALFDPDRITSRFSFLTEIKRHPENERFFDKPMAEVTDRDFSREYIYNPASALFVKIDLFPSFDKTVEMIHNAGGKVFLAHTYEYTPHIAASLAEMAPKLDGIECYYTTFSAEQTEYLCDFCKQNGLLMSGGSDFHGEPIKSNKIGAATLGAPITDEQVSAELLAMAL